LVLFAFRQIGREGKKDLAENPIDITDELKNPELEREYKPEEKVPNWVLFVLCGLAPAVFLFCYALRYGQQQQGHEYESLGSFFRSTGSTWFVTDVLKVRCARPRPHIYQRLGFDIKTKKCQEKDRRQIQDAFMSFPSGHASLSFTTMVRVSLELTRILPMGPLHWLAWSPILLASYISWTRLDDNRHHREDVIVGAIIGIVFALLDNWIVVCSIIFLLILVDQLIIKEIKRKREETKVDGLQIT
jgi:diacylglycerol diphosphate phosphatase/phosphatidate phosphatase